MNTGFILACESLEPGRGGIARVARLMARAIAELFGADNLCCISLSDTEAHGPPGSVQVLCAGSRARFVWAVQREALHRGTVVYDSAGMARAHLPPASLQVRSFCWIHGIEVWESARTSRLRALRRMDHVISNSAYTLRRAERLHGRFRAAHICSLATELEDAPQSVSLALPADSRVLTVGRMDSLQRYKGHDELLHCWPSLLKRVCNATLVIVGDGCDRPRLIAKARSLGLEGVVSFPGFVDESSMHEQWHRASVFAMPSRGEGFGIVYAEAMRYRLPVVASTHDAGQEVNVHGVTGLNVDLQGDSLTDALALLLNDSETRSAMGDRAFEHWFNCYRYPHFRERMARILSPDAG